MELVGLLRSVVVMEEIARSRIVQEDKSPTQKVKIKITDKVMDQETKGISSALKICKGPVNDNGDLNTVSTGKQTVLDEAIFIKDVKKQDQSEIQQAYQIKVRKTNFEIANNASQAFKAENNKQHAQPNESKPMLLFKKKSQLDFPQNQASVKRNYVHEMPSPNRSQNGKGRIFKQVMDCTDAFNTCETNPHVDIILDTQEINKTDLEDENFREENLKLVDRGSFGCVYQKTTKNGNQIVVKDIESKPWVKVDPNEILTPFELQQQGNGIVRIFAVMCRPDRFLILMEDAGMSLKRWLTDGTFRSWVKEPENLKKFSIDLFKIIKVLEVHAVVHRDIKPENLCLVRKDWTITLVDFGSAQAAQDKAVLGAHTTEYLPPKLNELIWNAKYGESYSLDQRMFFDEKCDTWAIAIIILSLFNNGNHPIPQVNCYSENIEEQRKQVMELIMAMKDGSFDHLLCKVDEPLQKVLRGCLCINKDQRWTARQSCSQLEDDGQRVFDKIPRLSTDISLSKNAELPHLVAFLEKVGRKKQASTKGSSPLTPVVQCRSSSNNGGLQLIINPKNPLSSSTTLAASTMRGNFIGINTANAQTSASCSQRRQDLGQLGIRTKQDVDCVPKVVGIGNPRKDSVSSAMNGQSLHRKMSVESRNVEIDFKATNNIPHIILNNEARNATPVSTNTNNVVNVQPVMSEDYTPSYGGQQIAIGTMDTGQNAGFDSGFPGTVPRLDMILDDDDNDNCKERKKRPRRIATGRRRSSNSKQ